MKNNGINQKEETHQRSCDVVGSDRARSSAVGVGLARLDAPPDHVGDSDGLDPTIGGELKFTRMRRIDPHRDARLSVLYEELARRVRVNPQVATLVVDRELIAPEPALRLCRCGLCHAAPPFMVVVEFLRHSNQENKISKLLCRRKIGQNSQGTTLTYCDKYSISVLFCQVQTKNQHFAVFAL